MRFTILGCYSPFAPYKGACNGYLLENNNKKIMIDCGNGTFANLQGQINYIELDAVIITHFHSDHFCDFELLRKAFTYAIESGIRSKPLVVFAPKEDESFEKLISYKHIFELRAIEDYLSEGYFEEDMLIEFFKTKHTIPCYGIKAILGDRKISYTSDTGFDNALVEDVFNSDILFAEASLLEKDKNKTIHGHMTAKQAGQLAELSSSKKLILTHLNPIYNLNLLKREAEVTFEGKVETAKMFKTYNI